MKISAGVIALVDDDPFILRALEHALLVYQYRVQLFTSAEQYLEEANAAEISCVVIDIDLGRGLSGLDLADRISQSLHAPPIVFMTGSDDPSLRAQALGMGCIDVLQKPFLTSMLVSAIMRLEDRRSCLRPA